MAMSKCIKGTLFTINWNTYAKIDQPLLIKQLNELIEFHSRVKRLSKSTIFLKTHVDTNPRTYILMCLSSGGLRCLGALKRIRIGAAELRKPTGN